MELYSTVKAADGKAHFVDPSDDRNDFDSETTEVDQSVTSLCSFEKDEAVKLDSEEVAAETLGGLCGHCSRAVDEETMAELVDLAGFDEEPEADE